MTTAILNRSFQIVERHERVLRWLMCASALIFLCLVGIIFSGFASWDLLTFLFASAIFVAALCMVRPYSGASALSDRRVFFSATLVIWIFLLLSEGIFVHFGSTNTAEAGRFSATAYFEALSWGLSFAALAFITLFRPAYLRRLFTGVLKWASIFCIIAVLSCPLSPNVLYSASLAFKLCVVVLTLFAIEESSEGAATVPKLFFAMFVGILILTFAGFATPFLGPGPVFAGSRFGSEIGLSGIAGMLLLLSVLFFILKKNPWFLAAAGFSLVVMLLVGGKGGIIASFLSFMMFFALLKNARQAAAACLAFTVIFLVFVMFTPLGHVLQSYDQSGNGSTLSGRVNLWTVVWPEIKHKPIFGHGYRASRFVSAEVEGTFAEAGHIHNVFLEILYNNGIAGLLPVLVMNFFIVGNLGYALKRSAGQMRYYAAAAFALYIHLLLWGITAPTFGSAADSRFMTFFVILLVSMQLKSDLLPRPESKLWPAH